MLTQVEARTPRGTLLTLPLQDVSGGFVVENIEGLDPVKATIVSSSFAQLDGEQYQSARREKRNIIITLALEPDYVNTSVQSLRNKLFQFFMPKSPIKLNFVSTDLPTLSIEGRVESFTAPKFSKDPQVTISILNFDPDFYDPTVKTLSGDTVGNIMETNYTYDGTVETGVLFKLFVNRTMSDFSIYHRPEDDVMRTLDFSSPTNLLAGDVLSISSQPGNKYCVLTRTGVDSSLLFGMSPQSSWLNLYPGLNKIRVFAEGAAVPYTIEYTTKYGGL